MTIPAAHTETNEANRTCAPNQHAMVEATLRQAHADLFEQKAWSAEQELAVAVFAQAVRDVNDDQLTPSVRAAAAAFLLDRTEMFRFWITVAGLNGKVVQKHLRRWIVQEPKGVTHARRKAA